ncbi:Flp pilus assembly protein TadG [Loktanella sp. DSM 29012]|uniref:pilus assembly protein n=1 Tax=Loktanella sp. DSM 29012 TaxID=1881056 RepID=UPI0008C2FE18|nr:Tad domain-containing protein [Loktanella sp. DSM 29012]SEP97447.1 Flp pilus assembly protein TadG [Loktanella sp. DSM 29012]
MKWLTHQIGMAAAALRLRRFARDENGTIIMLTLILLIPMIIVGGIAVDFMRFEAKRARLQGITDTAVLASANLRQPTDAKTLITDHFTKAGEAAALKGEPVIVTGRNVREVTVQSYVQVRMHFLSMFMPWIGQMNGPEYLTANSQSTAIQGSGKIEVSLVLDLSGSMEFGVPGTTFKRMKLVTDAAEDFIDQLLDPALQDRVSISIIPYSDSVNAGPEILDALDIDPVTQHGFSHCIEFDPAEYATTVFDDDRTYRQTQPVMTNSFGNVFGRDLNNPAVTQPICPRYDFERMVILSQNADLLKGRLASLEPRAGTAIHEGMKWATTLLDPSFNDVVKELPNGFVDGVFRDRPSPYTLVAGANTSPTLKYIVLLTDGQNSASCRLNDEFIDTPSEMLFWANNNMPFVGNNRFGRFGTGCSSTDTNIVYEHDGAQADTWLSSTCTAAKNRGIKVYTISVTGNDTSQEAIDGRTVMRNCANDPSQFFATTGANLGSIFSAIADQITELRLTQ